VVVGTVVVMPVLLVAVVVDVVVEVVAIVAILVNVLVVGANVVLVIVATSATIAAENAAEADIEDDHAVLFSPSPGRHLSSRLLPARRPSVPTQRMLVSQGVRILNKANKMVVGVEHRGRLSSQCIAELLDVLTTARNQCKSWRQSL
jgi:hypothetical protein